MGDAIELRLFPSCYNCLSWSSDGELAIAAGDSVHLQLPQWKPNYVHPLFEKEKSMPWTSAKFRVNVFTNKDWKVVWPTGRDAFSIGAEQSLSTVAGLAWSPEGLGLHRRCVLAVLTSNLVLSLYEADGQRKTWSRTTIVNKALEKYFRVNNDQSSSDEAKRKTRIRSFAWCPPLKNDSPSVEQLDRADVRWGECLLTVATDDNTVALIRVKRNSDATASCQYAVEVLAHLALNDVDRNYTMVPPGSLWADALKSRCRILHLACGPWSRLGEGANEKGDSKLVFGALFALVFGSNLHFLNVQASMITGRDGTASIDGHLSHTPDILASESEKLEDIHFTGPLCWIPIDASRLLLVAGSVGGRATLRFDNDSYENLVTRRDVMNNKIDFNERFFQEKGYVSVGAMYSQHFEPVTGVVAPQRINEPNETRKVYLATLGAFAETAFVSTMGTSLEETLSHVRPPWTDEMEQHRQKYDMQYQLGNMALVRPWGLATFDGWTAVAFTMHPGDALEYTIRAEESTVIVFTHPQPDTIFPKPANLSDEHKIMRRDNILQYILSSASHLRSRDLRSARVIYAACICAINMHYNSKQQHQEPNLNILSLTHQALNYLSTIFNLPVTEELTLCNPSGNSPQTISPCTKPKTASNLQGPGGWIFEKCQTCFRRRKENVSLCWRNDKIAVCENGHTWNRCALTFLAIQQPYISTFCSVCDTNVLARDKGVSEMLPSQPETQQHDPPRASTSSRNGSSNTKPNIENIESSANGNKANEGEQREDLDRRELYDMLYDRYDTCAYCGGKYQDE